MKHTTEKFISQQEYSRKYNLPLKTLKYRIKHNLVKTDALETHTPTYQKIKDDPNIFLKIGKHKRKLKPLS